VQVTANARENRHTQKIHTTENTRNQTYGGELWMNNTTTTAAAATAATTTTTTTTNNNNNNNKSANL